MQPLLAAQDLPGLLALLKSRWQPDQIRDLLQSSCDDARKVALLALGLVGRRCAIGDVSACLKDPDATVNQIAEHALWSIWFRNGTCPANQELCRGTQALGRREFACAISHFDKAIEADPSFAEAYNQRAITYYLLERFEDSLCDCRRAAERMPVHFGAWAGMGHCQAHLHRLPEAIECYEKALELNPHLECIKEAVQELRQRVQSDSPS